MKLVNDKFKDAANYLIGTFLIATFLCPYHVEAEVLIDTLNDGGSHIQHVYDFSTGDQAYARCVAFAQSLGYTEGYCHHAYYLPPECDTSVRSKNAAEYGEFFPYGGALDIHGEAIAVSATDGQEQPLSSEVISLLKDGFKQGISSNKYRATALIYDVRVTLPTGQKKDAIAISLNHRDPYSITLMFPYQLTGAELIVDSPFVSDN